MSAPNTHSEAAQHESKTKLLDAALYVIRAKGYSATRVEDICEAAGLTKGSFFHHFKGKEDLAVAAADHFSLMAGGLFTQAPYQSFPDPLDRLLGYVDFRKAILLGDLPEFTCLLGTMVQETYETHPRIREACDRHLAAHAHAIEADIAAALAARGLHPDWTAESLALYTQAVIQGSFVLAKAQRNAAVSAGCLDHLRRYLELLFRPGQPSTASPSQSAQEAPMALNETPDTVQWPETHYIFLEKIGPIPQNAPEAWQEFHKFMPELQARYNVTGAMSLYKTGPQIYRAGYMLADPPANPALDLPAGIRYEKFPGGKYARFVLKGPYPQLGPATGRAFQLVAEQRIPLRDDFNIENYVNDPSKTPEAELITEILFPTA